MKLPFIAMLVILSTPLLTACNEEAYVASDYEDPYEDYVPTLRSFDIIDSYQQDTALSPNANLALSPYVDYGFFEFFWRVNSLEDYTITLSINDRPDVQSSIPVHSEVCGAGRWCDQRGNLICEYTTDFYMSCDNSDKSADIAPLFSGVFPQPLYLFLEVCDKNSDYCEYDYYPVSME
jgi:hypothetical protein